MKKLFAALAALCMLSCNSAQQQSTTSQTDTTTTNSAAPDTSNSIAAAPSPTKAALDFAYGIDISKYQGDEIDFISRKQDTLAFVICKATEGLTMIDPDFKDNWNTITQKGFIRGAYHFYHSSDDALKQAEFFLSTIGSLGETDFPPIIDFEETSIAAGQSVAAIQKFLSTFLQMVAGKTGRNPIIYTDNNTGGKYLMDTTFQRYHLFIADYSNASSPRLPSVWKKWALWQRSESYELHSTTDDFDIFNGNLTDLNRFISGN